MRQIDPIPFEQDDFGAAGSELELRADRQRNDMWLQAFGFHEVELTELVSGIRTSC